MKAKLSHLIVAGEERKLRRHIHKTRQQKKKQATARRKTQRLASVTLVAVPNKIARKMGR